MDATGNARISAECPVNFPPSNCQAATSRYINTVFQGEGMIPQPSNTWQAVASTNVYDECAARSLPPPNTTEHPRQKDNSKQKNCLILGGVSSLSMLVAIAALVLASFVLVKQVSSDTNIGDAQEELALSCLELLENGEIKSGIFTIRPKPNTTSFSTFCDMTSGGGGWTLVASVHENNIDGKCTVGDKWSSEQGIEHSALEASGSWKNYDVFGDLYSLTSSDYKNPAYYNLKATDIMLWHVPNDVNIDDIEEQAFLKYYSSDNFLAKNGSTLRNFFAYAAPLQSVPVPDLHAQLSDATWFQRMRAEIPDFYNYIYDGRTPDRIRDGGRDMYDGGNMVSFSVNYDNYSSVTYGEQYGRLTSNYVTVSAPAHPFIFLAWIGFENLDSFKIRVISDAGADGRGRILTYTNSFDHDGFYVRYRTLQIYDAGDPSICEVYFDISNIQKWKSRVPQVSYPRWSTSTNSLENEIQFEGARNILTGYTLLSREAGGLILQNQIINVLRVITEGLQDTPFSETLVHKHTTPITFEKGSINVIMSRVPTSQVNDVTPGFIELTAIDEFGYPYALCPGLSMDASATPSVHCVGGINSNRGGRNSACGDFADWNKGGNASHANPSVMGRSLEDIQSSILIFTREGN